MTAVEELALIKRAQNADKDAMMQLINAHQTAINSATNRFPFYLREDLRQQAIIGLMKAVYEFNPAFNTRLSTLALYKIKAEIMVYLRKQPSNDDVFEDQAVNNEIEQTLLQKTIHTSIVRALLSLDLLQYVIITDHIMYERKTLLELGKEFSLSHEGVRQIEKGALKKLYSLLKKFKNCLTN